MFDDVHVLGALAVAIADEKEALALVDPDGGDE